MSPKTEKPATVAEAVAAQNVQMVQMTNEELQTLLATTANLVADKVLGSVQARLQAIEASQATAKEAVQAAAAQAVAQVPTIAPTAPAPAPVPAPAPIQAAPAPELTLSERISRLSDDAFIDLCVEHHTMPRSNWDFCPVIDILRQGKYGHWQGAISNGVKTALLAAVAVGKGLGYVKFGQ